jgi:hypothetical protein
VKLREMSSAALRQALRERLTLGKYEAGRCFGWGRRATDAAAASGALPLIGTAPNERVASEWVKRQLQITEG